MKDNLNNNLIAKEETIGDIEGEKYINLMQNFINKSYNEVVEFCNKNNIKLDINYVNGKLNDIVTNQSIHELTDLKYVNNLTIDVIKNETIEKTKIDNNDKNSNIDKPNNPANNNENNNVDENNIDNNSVNNNSVNNNSVNNENNTNINTNSYEIDPIINELLN